jgi:hypothetical protein
VANNVEAARVVINVQTNGKAAVAEIRKVDSSLETLGKNIALAAVSAAAIKAGGDLIKLASDAEETQNKFDVTFSGVKNQADTLAENLEKSFGLSSRAAQGLLSDTGDLLTGFGFSQSAALDLSNEVQKLAVDLASFTNFSGGAEGASQALTKALLGERESIKSLGIAITEADIKQLAEDKGVVGELDRQTKAALTLELALSQSKNAIGDFERSQESFAAKSRLLTSELENVAVELGQELLPIAVDVIEVVRDVIEFFGNLSDGNKRLILTLAALAAAAGPVAVGIKGIGAALSLLAANPIALAIAAVSALTLAYVAYKNEQEESLRLAIEESNAAVRLAAEQNQLAASYQRTAAGIDAAIRAGRDVNEVLKQNEGFVKDLADEYPGLTEEVVRNAIATGTLADEIERVTTARAQEELKRLRDAAKKISGELEVSLGTAAGRGRQAGRADLQVALGLSGDEAEQFNKLVTDTVKGFALGDIVDADGFNDATALSNVLLDLAESFKPGIVAANSAKREFRQFGEETFESIPKIRELAESLLNNAEAQTIQEETIAGAEDAAKNALDRFNELNEQIDIGTDTQNEATDADREREAQLRRLQEELEAAARAEEERQALNLANRDRLFEQTEDEIAILERRRDRELELAREKGAELFAIEQFYANEIERIRDEQADKQKDRIFEELNQWLGLVNTLTNSFSQFTTNLEEQELQRIQETNKAELEKLEAQGASEEELKAKQTELEEQFDAKKRKIERDRAIRERNIKLALATIDTAAAVAEALPNVPLSIIAGLQGAAQIAVIASTPIPAAQFGGEFTVPPGNPADSGLVRVNEGEKVNVSSVRDSGSGGSPVIIRIGEEEIRGVWERGTQRALDSGRVKINRPEIIGRNRI